MKNIYTNKMRITHILFFIIICFFNSCATYQESIGQKIQEITAKNSPEKISHEIFLLGDAGNLGEKQDKTLLHLKSELEKANKNSTLIILGDNIYPNGLPDKNDESFNDAKKSLLNQLEITKNFKGKTYVIPGNHDWYSGLKGLMNQKEFVNDFFKSKDAFLPKKDCPISVENINEDIVIIAIDSEWYLQDWNKHVKINDDCFIKNREEFFIELDNQINKNQNKTILLTIHHPLFTNGSHDGNYTFSSHFYPHGSKIPLPVLGSLYNVLRKTSGISPQDLQNKIYLNLVNRLKPMIQNRDNIIVVSGHDHNLQYIKKEGIQQIISGSGSKAEAVKSRGDYEYAYGNSGFVKLNFYENDAITADYFSTKEGLQKLKSIQLQNEIVTEKKEYEKTTEKTTQVSIYPKELTQKTGFYNFLWGKHFRKYYSTRIEAPVVNLDTLFGGLKPKIAGGGNQSFSLRLQNKEGKEYVMRGLRKSAIKFLQRVAFSNQSVETDLKNTYVEKWLLDFYTTAHPYTPFIVNDLADKINIYHTNPKLYYIPKQNALGKYNSLFGDELYLFEERTSKDHLDKPNFGKPVDIVDSNEVLLNIKKDEKYSVDESSYIRARLFDMLIGDWDRHADQWRWSQFNEGEKVIYKPIPRDRDQAFSKVDGLIMGILLTIPDARQITNYTKEFPSHKWFNAGAHALDIAFVKNANWTHWKKEVDVIVNELSDEFIDQTFQKLPKEIVNDVEISEIISKLKYRKTKLEEFAKKYYEYLQERVILTGTNKDDLFIIERLDHDTQVTHIRKKKKGDEVIFSKKYSDDLTNEIWIYGLDDDDIFEAKGNGNSSITIRLIGGQNKDTYAIENSSNIKVYDYKTKESVFKGENVCKVLEDNYDINEYQYKKPKMSPTTIYPNFGSNPDDGFKLGVSVSYKKYGFIGNPFTYSHSVSGNYFFATNGFELKYNGIYHLSKPFWSFQTQVLFTSSNFTQNFFGFGNETKNNDKELGLDYNRVRIEQFNIQNKLVSSGRMGSEFSIGVNFENYEVEETSNRFINQQNSIDFNWKNFGAIGINYKFQNLDQPSNPTTGFTFVANITYRNNLNNWNQNFFTIENKIGFDYPLVSNKKLVLATILKNKIITNNNFEFYQGATIGGDQDIRGLRNERFLGKRSFVHSNDVRYTIGKISASVVPMTYGLLVGFDYGRVFNDFENSNKWHNAFGGGLWINTLNFMTAKISAFKSGDEQTRFAFGFGFGF